MRTCSRSSSEARRLLRNGDLPGLCLCYGGRVARCRSRTIACSECKLHSPRAPFGAIPQSKAGLRYVGGLLKPGG